MSGVQIALQKIMTTVTEDPRFLADLQVSYDKRVIAQKVMYLLQSRFGANPRWSFNWYLAGPYSPGLARELYALADDFGRVAAEAQRARLSESALARVGRVKELLSVDYEAHGLSTADWLELLTSVDYVATWRGLSLESRQLPGQVSKAKPKFAAAQIEFAIEVLQERG